MSATEQRLHDLRAEHARGRELLIQLERQLRETREQLLRIEGGIHVCEELLIAEHADPADPVDEGGGDQDGGGAGL